MNLLIVESPAKAKTINKYLGSDYIVLASFGHVRDLPSKNGSVDTENNFNMLWEIDTTSKKHIKEIADAAKNSDKIILATDPDREGEAIAWHVKHILDDLNLIKGKKVERVVFNEITKKAVLHGIENPRDINIELVNAYLARRALDYLVGFNISPILWTKLPGSKSAGRVQSVALKVIVEREYEIELFKPEEFWTIGAIFKNKENRDINTKLNIFDSKKVEKFSFQNEEVAKKTVETINKHTYQVSSIESKPFKRNPYAPFRTSTMQQDASRKLGFGASRTMQIAQRLYQGIDMQGETVGLITYMRTDGADISVDAIAECRKYIKEILGEKYLPADARNYSGKKSKNAQEAHEAIRPTDLNRTPDMLRSVLDKDQFRLYELIWNRTVASQMESAEFERTAIDFSNSDNSIVFRANGSIQKFDGFLKLYQEVKEEEDKDDKEKEESDEDNILPEVAKDEQIDLANVVNEQHFTQPPPRYSEASLVKKLEELGIGRPSTYASIISVLSTRNYVEVLNKKFIPTDRGKLITAFLNQLFSQYVDYNFTAGLEESLDDITSGKIDWIEVLSKFWKEFNENVSKVKELRTREILDMMNVSLGEIIFDKDDSGKIKRACECGGELSLKIGRFGAFIGCSKYPDCKFTRPLSRIKAAEQDYLAEPKEIGKTEDDKNIVLKKGRFGPYLQVGNEEKEMKNVSIPKGISLDDINLEKARFLAGLPKVLGQYPENNMDIILNNGRYGPYIKCDKKSATLEAPEDIFTIGLNRAVTMIAEAKPGRRSSNEIKTIGEHPEDKKPIKIMKGSYGPYVKYKTINATIPDDKDPESITMEEALDLIQKRLEYDASKKGKTLKKKAPKKTKKKPKKKGKDKENVED